MPSHFDTSARAADVRFPTTRGSAVSAAASDDPAARAGAFDALVRAYWRPVYAHLRVRWRRSAEDARDVTQGFFARAFEKRHFGSFDPTQARFRTYLRASLDHYVVDLARQEGRQKRGGGGPRLSLDFDVAETELARSGSLEQGEGAAAIDAPFGGEGSSGLQGSGVENAKSGAPYKILVDVNGAAFKGTSVAAGYGTDGAVRDDGTVWLWGDCTNGTAGDGSAGAIATKPTKVHIPDGVTIKKLVFSDIVMALDTAGNVWTWGGTNIQYNRAATLGRTGDAKTPDKVVGLPSNIADIVSGAGFSYALTSDGHLYGWGADGTKLGKTGSVQAAPIDMQPVVKIPAGRTVKSVAANDHTTHVILDDGSLWGWGDNAMGEVGDGKSIDWDSVGGRATGTDAWDWGLNDMPVLTATRIAPDVSSFKAVYTNTAFVFYVFAVTEDNHLYSWGRNKTGNLMNGIVAAAPLYGRISAQYPNGWDVAKPASVNPFELTSNKQVTAPYCLRNPTVIPCTDFNNTTGKAVYEK